MDGDDGDDGLKVDREVGTGFHKKRAGTAVDQ